MNRRNGKMRKKPINGTNSEAEPVEMAVRIEAVQVHVASSVCSACGAIQDRQIIPREAATAMLEGKHVMARCGKCGQRQVQHMADPNRVLTLAQHMALVRHGK